MPEGWEPLGSAHAQALACRWGCIGNKTGTHLRRRAAFAILALLSIALVAQSAAAAAKTPKHGKVRQISQLYVLGASAATLTPVSQTGVRYRLRLKGLDRNVVWFADRPARRSGSFPASGLVSAWKGFGFTADPPNAALTYTDKAGQSRTAIVELTRPKYAAGKISFSARVLDPRRLDAPHLADHLARADRTPSGTLFDVSLFVDDNEAPVIDGCVFGPYMSCSNHNLTNLTANDLDGPNEELEFANFSGSNFNGAFLAYGDFEMINLTHASFSGASLRGTRLEGVNFTQANFFKADLSGVSVINVVAFEQADFSEADLSKAELRDSDFVEAQLEGASFAGANLNRANLDRANMRSSDFSGANLTGAEMIGVEIRGANFENADLSGAELATKERELANFCNATFPNGRIGPCERESYGPA